MIYIGSDHAAFEMRLEIAGLLGEMREEFNDLGVDKKRSVDYPDFAHAVAQAVSEDPGSRGILICGTGLGMSMSANRHTGIRAALCHDAYTAAMARRHNDANVLCMGARVLGLGVAEQVLRVFLNTPFDGGRHRRRVDKIEYSPI